MCAAKKAGKKAKASTNPGSRYLGPNPLPDGVAAPDLLVDLMTERAIDKCRIKENWEEPGGWEYDDLRAIVACALGKGFSTDQDRERMAVVENRTKKPLMKKIRAHGAPPLDQGDGPGETLTPEAYRTVLILGMFDYTNPPDVKMATQSGAMANEFADVMKVPVKKVKERSFEYAKVVVMDRYREHLDRRQRRIEFRSSQTSSASGEQGLAPLTQEQVFLLVCKQLAQRDFPGFKLTPERRMEVDGFLVRHGIRPPRK